MKKVNSYEKKIVLITLRGYCETSRYKKTKCLGEGLIDISQFVGRKDVVKSFKLQKSYPQATINCQISIQVDDGTFFSQIQSQINLAYADDNMEEDGIP